MILHINGHTVLDILLVLSTHARYILSSQKFHHSVLYNDSAYKWSHGVGYLAARRSGAQAAARYIHPIWWHRWDPSLTVVQGDPWIQNECGDGTDRGGPKKEGW